MARSNSPEFYDVEFCHTDSETEGARTPLTDPLDASAEDSVPDTVPETENHDFCTLRCLEGLIYTGELDTACPNVASHGLDHHDIGPERFAQRIRHQLNHDYYRGVDMISYSTRTQSVICKVTLFPWRYTVVLKAASNPSAYYQKRETQMYQQLEDVQGYDVPFCLGDFELSYPLRPPGVASWERTHFLVLAWAGHSIDCVTDDANYTIHGDQYPDLDAQVYLKTGIKHLRPLPRHICWNEEFQRPMLIDFSWALATKPGADLFNFGIHPQPT